MQQNILLPLVNGVNQYPTRAIPGQPSIDRAIRKVNGFTYASGGSNLAADLWVDPDAQSAHCTFTVVDPNDKSHNKVDPEVAGGQVGTLGLRKIFSNCIAPMAKAVSALILLGLLSGCTATKTETVSKDGTKTTRSLNTFMTKASNYEDSTVSPNGILSTTSVKNYAGDVEMMQAITAFAESMGKYAVLMTGHTNLPPAPVPASKFAIPRRTP